MIISITPEIGIDEIPMYAGGLGILEGDKFYEAAKRKLEYIVLTLFYKKGYVYYAINNNELVEVERDFDVYKVKLIEEKEFKVRFDNKDIVIKPLIYKYNNAKIVYFDIAEPREYSEKISRLYIDENNYWYEAKYTILAKAAYEYIKERIGFHRITTIDIQESLVALITLLLPPTLTKRLIIHTPGPWGHPSFSHELLKREFNYLGEENLSTIIAARRVDQVFAVSEKHYKITVKTFPQFFDKLSHITNGINLDRWMYPEIKKILRNRDITPLELKNSHFKAKEELISLLKQYKNDVKADLYKPIILWARRLSRYKRPYYMVWLIENLPDRDIIIVLGGKAHPRDSEGLEYMKVFRKLHVDKNNVVYIHDYDAEKAKVMLAGADIHLFTPFPGWEASGTSFMKAGVNGVPTIASRDGSALEMIIDGFNGWFFGSTIDYPIDLYSQAAMDIDRKDYQDLYSKLNQVLDLYYNNPDKYIDVAINALLSFTKTANIERVINEYYGEYIAGLSVKNISR